MEVLFSIFFGLLVGSFLNVVIWRVPRKLSIVSPGRSYCPKCNQTLGALENVPLLSWLIQLGRCRHCKASISGRYPLVEALSGAAAGLSVIQYGPTPTALVVYALSASLIAISFIDLDFKIIPNVISFPGMTIGLILGIISEYSSFFSPPVTQGALDSLAGFFLGGGFFYSIAVVYYWFTKRVGLGGGDVKLMAMIGAILGWKAIPPTIFIGSLFGAVIGVFLILFFGRGRHTEIPFGPWLSLGALIYLFLNPPFFFIAL